MIDTKRTDLVDQWDALADASDALRVYVEASEALGVALVRYVVTGEPGAVLFPARALVGMAGEAHRRAVAMIEEVEK